MLNKKEIIELFRYPPDTLLCVHFFFYFIHFAHRQSECDIVDGLLAVRRRDISNQTTFPQHRVAVPITTIVALKKKYEEDEYLHPTRNQYSCNLDIGGFMYYICLVSF